MKPILLIIMMLASTSHAQFFHNMILRNQRPTPVVGGGGAPDSTPRLVNFVLLSKSYLQAQTSGGLFHFRIGETNLSGNLGVIGYMCTGLNGNTLTIGLHDDAGNKWTQAIRKDDGNLNNLQMIIQYATNMALGDHEITITNSSGQTVQNISGFYAEFANITNVNALDVNSGNTGSNVTVTAGSVTPSQTGDLMIQWSTRYMVAKPEYVVPGGTLHRWYTNAQSDISWQLAGANLQDGSSVQWGVYSNTVAINPTATMANSTNFMSLVVGFKAAPAATGTPRPVGQMRVAKVLHQDLDNVTYPKTNLFQFPTEGNLQVATWASGSSDYIITNIVDSSGNVWREAGSPVSEGTQDTTQTWYATNSIANHTNEVTLKFFATTPGHGTIMFYDIVNANITAFDSTSTEHGDMTANSSTFTNPPAITPGVIGGIMTICGQWEFNTATNSTSAAGVLNYNFVGVNWEGQNLDGPVPLDQNGGWAFFHVPDATPVTNMFKFVSAADPLRQHSTRMTYFKP